MEKVKEKEKKILEINPNVFDVLEKILSTTELTSEERGVLEKSLSQYRNSQTENQSGEEKQRFGLEFVNKKERDIFVNTVKRELVKNSDKSEILDNRIKSNKNIEKKKTFKNQIGDFLRFASKDKDLIRLIDKYRNTKFPGESESETIKRKSLSDIEIFSMMSSSMYDFIHKSGMTYKEVLDGINIPSKDEFIKKFDDEIDDMLINAVKQSSKVRHISKEDLSKLGKSDQVEHFIWFKGNAPMPNDAETIRFYINASPDGTIKTAEYLGKLSDWLDQYGLRLQFKFRKNIADYDRTDTCVAYLYMPKAKTEEQKINFDKWTDKVKELMAKVPEYAVRDKESYFIEKITKGVAFVKDYRKDEEKNGESYTTQITKYIAESSGEVANKFRDLTPEAIEEITLLTIGKMEEANYFE